MIFGTYKLPFNRGTKSRNNDRTVIINGVQSGKYCSNVINTSKYNFLTFLPKFLFEQFRRYANIYFLLISLVQMLTNLSPTGKYTTAVPLSIILTISAIKEIIEDYKRHKADDVTNNHIILVSRNNEWVNLCWKDLHVGDFVKLKSGQGIPADIILLSSSESHAMCYIETSNLDGETNFKMRQGPVVTSTISEINDLDKLKGKIVCETPNRHMYEFFGYLSLPNDEKLSINFNQLLLRGAILKNTKWIIGIVVYTGKETKVMLNSSSPPLKRSAVEKMTNNFILVLFGYLLFLSLATAVGNYLWTTMNKDIAWYVGFDKMNPNNFGQIFLTAFIMYHTIIPLSLHVSLEIVRFVQAHFINMDMEMYDTPTDTPANARTSNLNEELGRVKYIFSDKTGTLTRNVMEFKQCSIGGKIYGTPDIGIDSLTEDKGLLQMVENEDPDVDMFFRALAICHTVVPEKDDNGEIVYQASSPDESALVKAAKQMGFIFHTRTPDSVNIRVRKVNYEYKVLNVLEFTSLRKRMTVIVRTPESKIILFTKGADNVIYERLSQDLKNVQPTLDHLEEFAKIGLRTLCIAYREIPEAEYEKWKLLFHTASIAIFNREDKLAEAAEIIEKSLILIGASAIEDKLQDQVPETISNLAQAGIKIWMLTGDKQETAINIGYSCKLLTPTMSLCVLDSDTLDKTRTQLDVIIQTLGENLEKGNNIGLIVSGEPLKFALEFGCRDDFIQIAIASKAVICCRASPSQKAEIVTLIKMNDKNVTTLAIGDGANDIGMIQAAHVGVGISGLEGQQAASNSDYAIAQFRFLNRLLLVHGAWSYDRITKLILFFFYKNICFFTIHFWFSFVSGFSCQIIFERWSFAFFNVLFTAAPPVALGLFDRCFSVEDCIKYPQLYKESQTNSKFDYKIFTVWILNSLFHSLILFWLPFLTNNHDIPFKNGQTGSLIFFGNFIYTYAIITICAKAALEHTSCTWLSHLAIWASIVTWFIFFIIYSHFFQMFQFAESMNLMYQAVFSSGSFWFGILLIPTAALTPDVALKAFINSSSSALRKRLLQIKDRKPVPTVYGATNYRTFDNDITTHENPERPQ